MRMFIFNTIIGVSFHRFLCSHATSVCHMFAQVHIIMQLHSICNEEIEFKIKKRKIRRKREAFSLRTLKHLNSIRQQTRTHYIIDVHSTSADAGAVNFQNKISLALYF